MSELSDARDAEVMRAYQLCFNSPNGRTVLNDLATFCYGAETCIVPGDIYATVALEGRREALLHIMRLAKLNAEEILHLRLERIRQGIE